MDLQVLISTMNQSDHGLLDKMNIQSDAIVVNQCDRYGFENVSYKGYLVQFLSTEERGIGLSRNTALMRAKAEICLFADDDVTYVDDYKNIILEEFDRNPQADVLMFNVPSTNRNRPTYITPKYSRIKWYNAFRNGTVKIAFRTDVVKKANVFFTLLFGGGAKYSAGEDSLFIADCLKKGLKIYACPLIIGYVHQTESSWFRGYTNKYFVDKGAFFGCLSPTWAWLLCLQFVFRHRNLFNQNKTILEVFRLMLKGIEDFKKG